MLQFDVVAYQLENEYNVQYIYESVSVITAFWVICKDKSMLGQFKKEQSRNLAYDGGEHLTYLAPLRVNMRITWENGLKSNLVKYESIRHNPASYKSPLFPVKEGVFCFLS